LDDTEIHDFGFNFVTEDELKRPEKDALERRTIELTKAQRKIEGLKKIIWPFLESLKKDPLKSTIVWPNRAEKVAEIQKQIENFIEE
jgi:hypothetical protein